MTDDESPASPPTPRRDANATDGLVRLADLVAADTPAARRPWGFRGGEAVRQRFAAGEAAVPGFAGPLVTLHLGAPTRGVFRHDGRPVALTERAGNVMVVPGGVPAWQALRDPSDAINVLLEDDLVRRAAAEAGVAVDGWEIVGRFETLDPEIERIVRSFAAEIATTGLGGELYAEAMATQLAVLLLRRHSSLGRRALGALAREDAALGRPGGALGRAIDYVEVNLGRGLSLVEIAREAGVSPRQLSRLFTEATGLPPHRYVVRRRVERARDLLLRGEMPIAEVAQAVGFYDQAHLARHAKALLGATPGEIARSGRIVHPVGRIVQDR